MLLSRAPKFAAASVLLWGALSANILGRTGRLQIASPSDDAAVRQLQELVRGRRVTESIEPDFTDVYEAVQLFYDSRGYHPAWIIDEEATPQAARVLNAVQHAQEHGLNPQDYDSQQLEYWPADLGNDRSSVSVAKADLIFTVATLRYASALRYGRLNPRLLSSLISRQQRATAISELARAIVTPGTDVDAALQAFEPPFLGYKRTEQALRRYLLLMKEEQTETIKPPGKPVQPGDCYGDLEQIANRLQLLGDLNSSERPVGARYEGKIVDAVKHFQSRHGLASTGAIDRSTFRAINTPLSKRVEQLQLALERWRWVNHDVLPAIVVNIPEFELRAFDENHTLAVRMHVVVGKAYRHRTPVFQDVLKSVIVRPYWNVPASIQKSEIANAVRRDPSYLTRHRFEVLTAAGARDHDGGDLPSLIKAGRVRVRQLPGIGNALGLLKFDFPNQYGVYLHGTPQRELFAKPRRDFSHGCIRIEDPLALATWVLKRDVDWDSQRLANAVSGDRTIIIPVQRRINLLIVYGTAVVEEDGIVRFFDDVYGYDAELESHLNRMRRGGRN